jgi:universal stress protein E
MKNILVVADLIDNPQMALDKAQQLASVTIAKIHIAVFCYVSLATVKAEEATEIKRILLSRTKQYWENYIRTNNVADSVTYEVIWEENIVPWLAKHCESAHYDLIVKSGNRSETTFYTPTDWQLFRESKVPIYCVNDQPKAAAKTDDSKTIVVALDLESDSKEKEALNLALLEAGFQLSIQTNSYLKGCSAINIPTLLKDMNLIKISEHVGSMQEKILEKAEQLFDHYDLNIDNLVIQEGEPWKVITNTASKENADCIIVGSMGRKGISGKLIGNTAEKVIHYASCDLLVIPPQ